MKTLKPGDVLDVPKEVAVCPHCGALLLVDVKKHSMGDCYQKLSIALYFWLRCIEQSDDRAFWKRHFDGTSAYRKWQPVTNKVMKWMRGKYRVILEI